MKRKIEKRWVKIEGNHGCECKTRGGLFTCQRTAAYRHGFTRYCRQHAEIEATPRVIAELDK